MPVTASDAAAVHEYVRTFDGQPQIRMAILGADGVGKRSFVGRLNCNRFIEDVLDSHGSDQFALRIEVAGKLVYFEGEMLARPGPPSEYPDDLYTLTHLSLRHLEACVLMYEVSSPASFEEIKSYHQNFLAERRLQARKPCMLECSPVCRPRPTPYPGVLCVFANKNDGGVDEWRVSEADGRAFADSIGANFASISVKTGEDSGREVLEDLTMRILMKRIHNDAERQDEEHHAETRYWIVTRENARFWY